MKRYTVSRFREHLAEALDEADRGGPVVVERRGTRYTLQIERSAPRRARRAPLVEILDPAVAAGAWTWDLGSRGLRFRRRSAS